MKKRIDKAYDAAVDEMRTARYVYVVVAGADASGQLIIREGGNLDSQQRSEILAMLTQANEGIGALINHVPVGPAH